MRALPVLALLLTAMLAGCSDDAPARTDPPDDLRSTPTTGLVRGVVVDETVTPVPDAVVAVQGGNGTATDAEGRFALAGLAPGTHVLEVRKPGHETVQVTASVAAGEDDPDLVRVRLPRLPMTLPYVLPIQVSGLIHCEAMLVLLLETCDQGTGLAGSGQSRFFLPVDRRVPHAVQVEVQWSATQATGESLTLTFGACRDGAYCSPFEPGVSTLCQTWGPSVLWCRSDLYGVERSGGGTGGDPVGQTGLGVGDAPGIGLAVGADCTVCAPPDSPCAACGVGLVVDQEFDVFAHVFYNFEPEDGWLFTADGAPPVPGR